MSSYEDRMAEKYNFLKKENTEAFNKVRDEYTQILQNFVKQQYDK